MAPPPPDAAATVRATELEPGLSRCTRADDCVLSSYQPGCCVQACQPYAISKRDLAEAQLGEDCAAFAKSGRPCPPPAPCRPQPHRVVSATCQAGKCAAVLQRLP